MATIIVSYRALSLPQGPFFFIYFPTTKLIHADGWKAIRCRKNMMNQVRLLFFLSLKLYTYAYIQKYIFVKIQ